MTQDRFAKYFDSKKEVYIKRGPDMFPDRILSMDKTGIQAAGVSCETITVITCGSMRVTNILSHFVISHKASKTLCLQHLCQSSLVFCSRHSLSQVVT